MKKTVVLALAMAFTATFVSAQEQTKKAATPQNTIVPVEKAKQAADKMNSVLQLTTDQYQKVLNVSTNYWTQRAAINTQDREANTKIQTLNKERQVQLKTILTPEQQQKWVASKKEGKVQE